MPPSAGRTIAPDDLLHAIQYERILTCEALGAISRQELEKLYAEPPDYQDVPGRLGIELVRIKLGMANWWSPDGYRTIRPLLGR